MKLSGTTHLVALSGYNITVIVWALMAVLMTFLRRKWSFAVTVIIIIGFVLMTGAEASVVRAAVMGILVLLSREVGRIYDLRNAVVLAGLVMVFANPKVLVFDVGFQLSFLALLGIVYLRPGIARILRMKEEPGFLSWRDNLLTTASAQLAVMPLLISSFGSFSPTSLLSNVLVLETVPIAMGLGFVAAGAYFLSYYVALILGWLLWVILKFEILVIEIFAKLSLPVSLSLSWSLIFSYYIAVVIFILYARREYKNN